MDVALSTGAMALVPIIMALTSGSKMYVDPKWAPLVALVLSLVAAFVLVPGTTVTATLAEGILMALAASGLYSSGKTLGKATKILK